MKISLAGLWAKVIQSIMSESVRLKSSETLFTA